MKITIDNLLSRININKEELERIGKFEIESAFKKAVDIATGFGLRENKNIEYTFQEASREVNMTSLDPNFEVESGVIDNITSTDFAEKYLIVSYYQKDGDLILVLDKVIPKGKTIRIFYQIPYKIENNEINIKSYDYNILTLIFEGCLFERISLYYSKLSMKDLGSDITTNMDRARFYQEESSRYLTDASNLIKKRIPVGKTIIYQINKEYLTHWK